MGLLAQASNTRTVSASFLQRLKDTDSGLVVYFNPFKGKFVIDRCTNPDIHTHGAACPRTHVMFIETPEGNFMEPNDRAIDKLRSMDAWQKFGTAEKMLKAQESAEAEYKETVREEAREGYKEAMLDDKRQIQQAIDLIKRHTMHEVH